MMLYPYRTAAEHRVAALENAPPKTEAARLFFDLVSTVQALFELSPTVLSTEGERTLLLLFRDVSYSWEDITECVGETAANLSALWPIFFYGTTARRETGEVTVERDGTELVIRLRSVSGQPFDRMEGLCIRLEGDTPQTVSHLAALVDALLPNALCAAVDRLHEPFLQYGGLVSGSLTGSFFCYLTLGGDTPSDRLCSLTAKQKERLWEAYLLNGVEPQEFQWIWDAYQSGTARVLEWELTLQSTLNRLGFTVENRAGEFLVSDCQGRRRWFDLATGGPAEKLFLKLLFPLGGTQ